MNVSGLSSVEILSPYNELPWPLCNMTCGKIHVDFTNYTPTATKEYNALFLGKHAPIKGSIMLFCPFSFIFQDFPTLVFSRHSVSSGAHCEKRWVKRESKRTPMGKLNKSSFYALTDWLWGPVIWLPASLWFSVVNNIECSAWWPVGPVSLNS